jgi:TolB protein
MSDNGHQRHCFEFADFRLYPHERLLTKNGKRVALTPRILDLLIVLVEHDGELIAKETLLDSVWEDRFVEEGNLSRAVSTLRKKLGTQSNGSDFIETVPKLGYRFIAPVGEVLNDPVVSVSPGKIRSESREYLFALGALAVVLIFVLAFSYFWRGSVANAQSGPVRLTDHPLDDTIPRWTNDGRIRFWRVDGKTHQAESLIMNADGTDQTHVRDSIGMWSPDGSKVVFPKEGVSYLANADGSDEIAMPFLRGNLDWSADSRKIVYQAKTANNDPDIFIYSLQTGKSENVTNNPAFDADPSLSPDGKHVAFASARDGNFEIYLVNADGSDLRRLTNDPAWDNHPVFSPDGTTIAFNSDRENENSNVYLIGADGADIRRLTESKHNETVEPGCWSPDGTQIAFYSDEFGNDDIFVTSAEVFRPVLVVADATSDLPFASYSPDGKQIVYAASMPDKTGELRLFELQGKQSSTLQRTENAELQPVFAPDGMHIAFQNKVESNTEICLIRLDGTDLRNLTNNAARDGGPAFSPDGKQIAFASNRDGNSGIFNLYVMGPDGGDQRRVYRQPTGSRSTPAWLPDGTSIVFTNDMDGTGNFDLFKLRLAENAVEERLTFRPRYDSQAAISPDGRFVAFASNTDGNSEIYLMNSDGTNVRRMTRHLSEDIAPKFSPDGARILFSSNRNGKYAIYEMTVFP